jgi:uncharacterized repeat protein (TIGR03803 family)
VALILAMMAASLAPARGNAASLVMQTLHEFHYGPSRPQGSLLEDSDGRFYGVTADGGAHGLGTVYRMTRQGVLTTLISFDFDTGGNPYLQHQRASSLLSLHSVHPVAIKLCNEPFPSC